MPPFIEPFDKFGLPVFFLVPVLFMDPKLYVCECLRPMYAIMGFFWVPFVLKLYGERVGSLSSSLVRRSADLSCWNMRQMEFWRGSDRLLF